MGRKEMDSEHTHPQPLRGGADGRKVLRSFSCKAIRDFTAIGGNLLQGSRCAVFRGNCPTVFQCQ